MSKTYRNKPKASKDSLTGEQIWLCGEHKTQYFQRNSGRMGHKPTSGKCKVWNNNCPCCNRINLAEKKKLTRRLERRENKKINLDEIE